MQDSLLYILIYLLLFAPTFYWLSAQTIYKMQGELPLFRNIDEKWWQEFVDTYKLLKKDLVLVHCPWSWSRAIDNRVVIAHELLQRKQHEKGWRPEDCHDQSKHEQIAKDCFVSRKKFWIAQASHFLLSPIFFAVNFYTLMRAVMRIM